MKGNLVVDYGNFKTLSASLASGIVTFNGLGALAIPVDATVVEMPTLPSRIVGAYHAHSHHDSIIARSGGLSNGNHSAG